MNFIVDAQGLGRSFKSGKTEVEAVKNVTLQLEPGIIFGFLGPNGAGKTTTLRMLTTLLTPTKGSAFIAGYDLAKNPEEIRKNIGYVSQKGGCYRSSTARENIVLQGRLYGMSKQAASERAAELIKLLDLESFCDRAVETYSGGQVRRVDIAMGMIHSPSLLFLDEPTTGLDPQSRVYLWKLLKNLKEHDNMTIFLTTHYLDEADALCDRIAIIDHGAFVRDGSPVALKREIAGDIITIGFDDTTIQENAVQLLGKTACVKDLSKKDNTLILYVDSGEDALAHIVAELHTQNLRFKTVALSRPTLDDVFLQATGHSLREA
ncbi:MAG: Daunorubicin resistance ABC transporter ATPase subunit [candidate division TM6 bacterium GW2011_GWE2_42_60]|nr:MAG: Daunorubicin resistance ABC transporter ATPase subunit [candidate division TM6 bacterium GW2011_GWE2_42_60]